MIDTVKIYLTLNPETIPILHFQSRLENPKYTEGNSRVGRMNGYLKNLRISIQYDLSTKFAFMLSLHGSVPKFIFGNNLASCSPTDIHTFIDTLYSALDVDVSMAVVSCIDFGINFSVTGPVSDYLASIHSYPRLRKSTVKDESITFNTKSQNWAIIFYDKIKEIKAKKKPHERLNIPNDFYNLNILRYEIRFRKDPHKKFKRSKPLCLLDLTKKRLHKQMFKKLKTTFYEMDIFNLQHPTSDLADSPGFLKTYLALIGLKECGLEYINQVIQNQKYNVKNQSVKRSTLKKQLKQLAGLTNDMQSINAKNALDAKFGALESLFYMDN